MLLLVLKVCSIGEGPCSRSKRGVETPGEPSVHHSYDRKIFKMEDSDKRFIVYEN